MDMDLVVIFSFIVMIVLIITAGLVLAPISRKLGVYLEEAAIERRSARLAGTSKTAQAPQALNAAPPELLDALSRLEDQMMSVAERQTFVERLMEEKQAPSEQ